MAYALMPSQSVSSPHAKQMYTNGHFCYTDKFAMLTNRLGIVRHIAFLDDDSFKFAHPELILEKKTDSPDEDTSIGDASALVPVLKALIPYNPRNENSLKKVGYNEYDYPTCPNDPSLPMKYCGTSHQPFLENQHVYRRKKNQKSYHHKS